MASSDQTIQTSPRTTEDQLPSSNIFEIHSSNDFGRYLIAKRDIPAKTLVLSETPLIFAPADDHEVDLEDDQNNLEGEGGSQTTSLFCLKCCVHLNKAAPHASIVPCPQCGWPLCSKSCKSMNNELHEENECGIFVRNQTTFPPPHQWPVLYKSILVLRILQLLQKNPTVWNNFFANLEHHNDVREQKAYCNTSDQMILQNLEYFYGSAQPGNNNNNALDTDKIKTIIGIVNVNGFCANKNQSSSNVKLRKAKCLFQTGSLFAHSCAPNCSWTIDFTNGLPNIKVYSSVSIQTGDLLTIPYNTRHLFYGTLKRQILIENVAHFFCKCQRCHDPTEFGTFMSSPICFSCGKGFLISQDTSDHESRWICQYCQEVTSVQKVVRFITGIEDKFDDIQEQRLTWKEEFEKLNKLFEENYGKSLHENHYTLQGISTRMLEISVEKLEEFDIPGIDKFLWHCNYLMGIADVILPGFNGYQDQLRDYLAEGKYFKSLVLKTLLDDEKEVE